MKPVSNETALDQLRWRYAVKKFDPARKIAPADWQTLEESLRLSPSSYGVQPWKFVVVGDPTLRATLKAASWNQPQITDASHLVVFAAKSPVDEAHVDAYMARIAAVRGGSVADQARLKGMILGSLSGKPAEATTAWASRQVYIALGVFLTTAAMLGIDACPMEGIEPAKYDEILGLTKQGYTSLCVATAGYRADDDKHGKLGKVRFEARDVIAHV